MSYSSPFRLFLIVDPSTGERRQLMDKDKAEAMAGEIAAKTGAALRSVLKASKYWYTTRYLDGGKVRRVNTKHETRHAASRWIDSLTVRAASGTAEPRKQVFADAVDLWLKEKELARKAEKTLTDYRSVVSFWKEELGNLVVSSINRDDILRYFSRRESGELAAERRKAKGIEEKASDPRKPGLRLLQKDRVLLASFFRWAREGGLCIGNPIKDAPRWEPEEKEPQALTKAEVTRLLDACRKPYKKTVTRKGFRDYSSKVEYHPPPHLFGIVLTALHSLLRLNNVAGLLWREVDMERGVIKVAAAQVKTRRDVEVKMTPTLKAYFSSLPRGAPAACVFGENSASIRRSFKSAARRAGLPGLKFHVLRKTGATILLDSGVPLKVVQAAGGWKKADVLLKHYAAATAAQKERAVEVLDGLGA